MWMYPPPQPNNDVMAIAELILRITKKQEKKERKAAEAKKASEKKPEVKKPPSFSVIETAVMLCLFGPFVGLGYLYLATSLGAALKRTILP